MNIHEYQAKALLKGYNIPILEGQAVLAEDEIAPAVQKLSGPVWVVKSQIHAGGRGAGRFKEDPQGKGGVRVCQSAADAQANAQAMFGKTLVTKQTGPAGKQVNRLYIEAGCDIDRELYLSMLIDRDSGKIALVGSSEGGMDIETVAHETPEKIFTVTFDPAVGATAAYFRRIGFALDLRGALLKSFIAIGQSLYEAFVSQDAALIEINPLVVTKAETLVALDAKMSFDSNAAFRHPQLEALRDDSEEEPTEREAAQHDLNYIKLDGEIGCMVNGAGLAMATMDIIQLKGSSPANFLDVGGGASRERVATAFRLLLADPAVKVVLVNIFGGIMQCDIIAQAIVDASAQLSLQVPLVVRLEGTNVDQGKKILADSGLKIQSAEDLNDAAEKAVAALKP